MLRWRERWSRFLWSISGRLLLVMLLISLLPMGMVVLYNQAESAEMMKRLEIDALQLLAIGKARSLDRLFQDALNDALLVANHSNVRYFLYAYAPLIRHQGVVVVSVQLREFLAPLERLATQGFLNLLFVGIGVILISLIVARSITKPIRALVSAAHALKHDQFDQFDPRVLRHYAQGSDDMAELAQVFWEMAQAVEQRQDQLAEKLSELKIQIDQEKRQKSVAEITSTDYFQELRQRTHTNSPAPATEPQIGHTEGEARENEPPLPP